MNLEAAVLDMMNALGGARDQRALPQMPQQQMQGGLREQFLQQYGPQNWMDALRGGGARDFFSRQSGPIQAPGQVPGQQGLPTQIAPVPMQQFQAPQAPQNMVGQSYGVQGMMPGASPFKLPTY